MKSYRFCKKTYCARILIKSARFPPFGFDIAGISSNSNEGISIFEKELLCPDSDIESARFPPFGFDIKEISSSSTADISFLQKDLLYPDSDRERLVSSLRVRYKGDKL